MTILKRQAFLGGGTPSILGSLTVLLNNKKEKAPQSTLVGCGARRELPMVNMTNETFACREEPLPPRISMWPKDHSVWHCHEDLQYFMNSPEQRLWRAPFPQVVVLYSEINEIDHAAHPNKQESESEVKPNGNSQRNFQGKLLIFQNYDMSVSNTTPKLGESQKKRQLKKI